MEILKIKDWLKEKAKHQFDCVGPRWIIRLIDACPFQLGEQIMTSGGHAHILSFEDDCIHMIVQHAPESIFSSVAGIYKFQTNDIYKITTRHFSLSSVRHYEDSKNKGLASS